MSVPGFYIAHHPWFDADLGPDSQYKVGHTGDLRRRLRDDAYTTCFSSRFRYVHVCETATKEEAHRLEEGVLHCAHDLRVAVGGSLRELVRAPAARLIQLAADVAGALAIPTVARALPDYPPPPAPAGSPGPTGPTGGGPAPLLGPDELGKLGPLHVSPAAMAGPVAVAAADNDFDDLMSELLDGVEGLALAPRPAPTSIADFTRAAVEAREAEAARLQALPDDDGDVLMDDVAELDAIAELAELAELDDPAAAPLEERPYQAEAAEACRVELDRAGRAVLQMACRCGKTRVAHRVIEGYLRPGARILYLVPGLALLRQTARKLDHYGTAAALLLVGSDGRPLGDTRTLAAAGGLPGAATTDPDAIGRVCAEEGRPLLVISTYQSSALLPDLFDLIVFDECHRVCGDRKLRAFTHVLLTFERGHRLYMTATPRYDGAGISMKDRELFGGIAYRYHMREGIDAGHVNDFSVEIVGAAEQGAAALAAQVVAAMAAPGVDKLLVFCRSIRHAAELEAETAEAVKALPAGARFGCFSAHSRMARADITANLARFCAPGARGALFNCRLFQEGVEIPALNAIFFASPRHNPRDIIQSLCRPLNAMPGKPPSKVFVPVVYDPRLAPEDPANLQRFASIIPFVDALIAEDALLYEHLLDPAGVPYPIRWVESTARLRGARVRYDPDALLAAVRRAARHGGDKAGERLLRAARIPWSIGFAELERIVRECGRYPKTTDTYAYGDARVNFGQFYRFARESYAKAAAGEPQPLEPHQLRDLESLPGWAPYGIEGPYPWRECLDFLERWLVEHNGLPPMLEINCGGYVGLDASPLERLSGALTCINQGDGRDRKGAGGRRPGSGFIVDKAKVRDLDDLCQRWHLRWRKERLEPPPGAPAGAVGSLVEDEQGLYAGAKTFIQDAFARFKEEWKARGAGSDFVRQYFSEYPVKHRRQERADVWARKGEVVPPRWRKRAARKPPA